MEVFCCFLETRASGCTAFLYPTEHPRDGQGSVSPVDKAGDTPPGALGNPQQVTPAPGGGGTGQPSAGGTHLGQRWHRTNLVAPAFCCNFMEQRSSSATAHGVLLGAAAPAGHR